MLFKQSLITAISLAILSHWTVAIPLEPSHDLQAVLVDDLNLPESGEIVFAPLSFGDDLDTFDSDGELYAGVFEDWKQSVVREHNTYRAKYSAGPLTWSDALYPGTQQWAAQCKFQHSNGGGKYGENLAAGTGNAYGFSQGLKSWMDEASKYDYNHPGFSSGTGHFTQVVWKSTKQVACAIANCKGGTIFGQPSKYIVCRYSPPGNFIGHFPENVGRPR
ncbi:PR-1-like protein [Hymenopellis radicata]|nr:PR-1-like protein [Hymenopellis radicata]